MGRSLLGPSLAVAMLLLVSGVAHAFEAAGSASGRVRVGEDALLQVQWIVDLGPSRFVHVRSPVGRIGFDGELGTFGGRLSRKNATGKVIFPEMVTVPAGVVLRALEEGAPIVLWRLFVISSTTGVVGKSVALIEVPVSEPGLALTVSPESREVSVCLPDEPVIRWQLELERVAPLTIESAQGVLFSGADELAAPGGELGGVAAGRLELVESLVLDPEVLAAAFLAEGPLEYRRSFVARGGGFERTLQAAVALELVDDEVSVSLTAVPSTLELERAQTVELRWDTRRTAPCLGLTSSEVLVETPGEVPFARLDRPLQLSAGSMVTETLAVPLGVVQRLLDEGVSEVVVSRELEVGALPGAASLGAVDRGGSAKQTTRTFRRSTRLTWQPSLPSELEVSRLALRFSDGEVFARVQAGGELVAVAELTTTGRGPIRAIWELADPASTLGRPVFRPLSLVETLSSPSGLTRITLPLLPTELEGPHQIRLRILEPDPGFDEPVIRYEVSPAAWRLPPGGSLGNGGLPDLPPEPAPLDEEDPIEAREILLLTTQSVTRDVEEALGLEVKMRYPLETEVEGEHLVLTVFRTPRGVSEIEVLRQIRLAHPGLWVDANTLYRTQNTAPCDQIDLEEVKVAVELMRWTSDLEPCTHERPLIGIIDTYSHGSCMGEIIDLLIPRVNMTYHLVEPRGKYKRTTADFAREMIDTVDIARGLSEQTRRDSLVKIIHLGFAGESNLILRYIFNYTVDDDIILIAPYNKSGAYIESFPATSKHVTGVLASNVDKESLEGFETGLFYRVPVARECENSCASAIATAATWILGAEKVDNSGRKNTDKYLISIPGLEPLTSIEDFLLAEIKECP